ncbi:hypothetical protein RRG08_005226 [Elysia crispata]|uniref:Uncharacterized protein n=1 Tax=Elysia crispata TaxID=231223 RepID=A0AAE1AN34_9GAST|nr:hypothetical protein RRG08_005226 [Elysia crispata]
MLQEDIRTISSNDKTSETRRKRIGHRDVSTVVKVRTLRAGQLVVHLGEFRYGRDVSGEYQEPLSESPLRDTGGGSSRTPGQKTDVHSGQGTNTKSWPASCPPRGVPVWKRRVRRISGASERVPTSRHWWR